MTHKWSEKVRSNDGRFSRKVCERDGCEIVCVSRHETDERGFALRWKEWFRCTHADPARRPDAGQRGCRVGAAGMSVKYSPWSKEEDALLLRLFDVERLNSAQISHKMPGRTQAACQIRYYKHLGGAKRRPHRPGGPKPSSPAVSWRKRGAALAGAVAAPAAPVAPLTPAAAPVHRPYLEALREHAELRLRIAERGIAGGVLGDPPPGRSALDQRRGGNG